MIRPAVLAAALAALILAAPAARAATLTATRPGVMCASPDALARLTRPDGSSRAASPAASPETLATKRSGGCLDIPAGARVEILATRHNTSIVTYDPADGAGPRRFIAPNIDFTPATPAPTPTPAPAAAIPAPGPHRLPAWPEPDYPPLVAASRLFDALHARCPQQGWNEHLLSHTETGPWQQVADSLTPGQTAAMRREVEAQCRAGLSCIMDIQFGMEVQLGHLPDLVRAICAVKAAPDD